MPKLGYIIGFAVVFFLLSTVVGSASVVGLRGGENKGDPGSVGDQLNFGQVTDAQKAIAHTAQTIAEGVRGQETGKAVEDYKNLIRKHLKIEPNTDPFRCTPCNYFAIVVMRESGADPKFEHKSAEGQFLEYIRTHTDRYSTFALSSETKDDCKVGNSIDSAKRGDLLYTIRGKLGGTPGHVGIYLGDNRVASASIRRHSPEIINGSPERLGFECVARLISVPVQAAQTTTQ